MLLETKTLNIQVEFTNAILPTLTIGLTNYINFSYQQIIGIRSMDWMRSEDSAHHRDEHSLEDFLNANGRLYR